jgi:uncharacterized protein (TIGR02285 family)
MKTVLGRQIILLLAALWSYEGALAEQIDWMVFDYPPLLNSEGALAGAGPGDRALQLLIERLPGFEHRIVAADVSRSLVEMRRRDGVCMFGATQSAERAEWIRFSRRPILMPGLRLITLPRRLREFDPYLDGSGAVDLALLARNHRFRGAYVQSAQFPGPLRQFVATVGQGGQMMTAKDSPQLMAQLRRESLDYVVDGGLAVLLYQFKFPRSAVPVALRLRDLPERLELHIACANRPLGAAVIEQVDRLLADDAVWRQFLAPLRRALSADEFAAAVAAQPSGP